MNLDHRMNNVLRDLHSTKHDLLPSQTILSLMDVTRLDASATRDEIYALALQATQFQAAAICILPDQLSYIPSKLSLKRTTTLNFPSGEEPHQSVLEQLEWIATHEHLHEIEYVFPYQTYLANNESEALSRCQEVFNQCQKHHLVLKVILETGALPSAEVIYQISTEIIQNGCDFLKTSTGKRAQSATLPAAFSIMSAIIDSNRSCGIKISGGIKTLEQALDYIHLAQYMFPKKISPEWFRFGASQLGAFHE